MILWCMFPQFVHILQIMLWQHNYFIEIQIILIDWNCMIKMQLQTMFMSKKSIFCQYFLQEPHALLQFITGHWTNLRFNPFINSTPKISLQLCKKLNLLNSRSQLPEHWQNQKFLKLSVNHFFRTVLEHIKVLSMQSRLQCSLNKIEQMKRGSCHFFENRTKQ